MLNEYDLFRPLTLNNQILYDDCMPPTYDDYCADTYVKKVVIIIVLILSILLLNITLLMWEHFIVFKFPMILPLL